MVAEEFRISPREAELQDVHQCQRIMALRRFRDAVAEIERGTKQEDLPKTPMMAKALECVIVMSGIGGRKDE